MLHLAHYADSIAEGIVYLSEDRKGDGLFLDMSIAANVSALCVEQVATRTGIIDDRRETEQAERLGGRLNLRYGHVGQPVSALSGGNQQKVAIAKMLSVSPKVIFLDEPTRGVDVGAKAEIHRILRDLARGGVGIVVISSELPELIGVCDRVLVVREGRIAGEVTGDEMTEETIMYLASIGERAAGGVMRAEGTMTTVTTPSGEGPRRLGRHPGHAAAPAADARDGAGPDHPGAVHRDVLRLALFPDLGQHARHGDGLRGRGDRGRRHDDPADLGRHRPVGRFGHRAGDGDRRPAVPQRRRSLGGVRDGDRRLHRHRRGDGLLRHPRRPAPFHRVAGGDGDRARRCACSAPAGRPLGLYTLPPEFKFIGQGSIGVIPVVIVIFVVVVVAFDFMLRRTTMFRKVFYTGSNEKAAAYSGIRTKKVVFLTTTLCSALCGVAGVIYMARFGSAQPTFGIGMELNVIAAAVIGGASLSGGSGTIFGAILGTILLSVVSSSLALLDVSVYWQDIIRGSILLTAVTIDHYLNKRRG